MFNTLIMGPNSEKVQNCKKTKSITIELKKEIVAKHENGVRVTDLAKKYNMTKSTISTIIKNKEAIKAANVAKGVTVLTRQRSKVLEEVEKLLLVWINDRQLAGDIVSEAVICEKARLLHNDLLKQLPSNGGESFKASRGWFEKFRRRTGIHSVIRHGEEVSSNKKEFVDVFENLIEGEDYISHQVFSCDEGGLFWKKIPKRTYITQEEPDHKHMKEELTTEVLPELHCEQVMVTEEDHSSEEEVEKEVTIPSSVIKDMCNKWSELEEFVKKHHPNKVVANRVINLFNDNAMSHFRKILQERKRQTCLDQFLVRKT